MALPDFTFVEGFDKYGPVGKTISASDVAGEWSVVNINNNGSISLVNSLLGSGVAVRLFGNGGSGHTQLIKNLPNTYARCVGGFYYSNTLINGPAGITFGDTNTAQLTIGVDGTGFIRVYRGWVDGTVIATSAQSVTAGGINCIEYDITIHNTTGIVKVWLNGVMTSLNLTGQNTRVSANNYYNQVWIGGRAGSGFQSDATWDHMYHWCYISSGGSETPALTNPIVETQFGTSDDTAGWSVGPHACQNAYVHLTTNAPGANQLMLVQRVADASGTLDSLKCLPNTTSGTAKLKAVAYADSSGQPGALIATGTEVVGCTAGTELTLPFSGGPSITAGTAYWIGLINDTSILFYANNTSTGYSKANTYTSGPPSPAGTGFTTGRPTWNFLMMLTGVTTHYTQEDELPPLDNNSYNYSSTIGQQELYNFPALGSTPTAIYTVAVKGRVAKSDSGARTLDLQTKSSSTTSSGSLAGQAPSLTYGYISSYYNVDPATSVAWTGSGVNAAKHGIKVAS